MNTKSITLYYFSLALVIILFASSAYADGAYQWKDKQGRVFYGTKPPKNGHVIKNLSSISISRYSTKKILKRSGYKTALLAKKHAAKQSSAFRPALLTHKAAKLSLNDKSQITNCAVKIKNTGDLIAHNVIVSFEFEDGTTVPGVGPSTLTGLSEAEYKIAKDQLPITIKDLLANKAPKRPKVNVEMSQADVKPSR